MMGEGIRETSKTRSDVKKEGESGQKDGEG